MIRQTLKVCDLDLHCSQHSKNPFLFIRISKAETNEAKKDYVEQELTK